MAVKHIEGNAIKDISASKDKISLIDFSADWCSPCKMLNPVLDEISNELPDNIGIYHIDVDHDPAASSQYSIRGVPTMIVFHDGREIDRMVGFRDANSLKDQLSKLSNENLTVQ